MTLDHILTGLKATVAEIASKSIPAQCALLCCVWSKISRINARFTRLYAHWQAGTVPPIRAPRPRKPRESKTPPESAATTSPWPVWPPVVPLPRRRCWLLAILRTHLANIRAGQLEHLLTLPEIQQFRAEVPRADRLLRPLCIMLDVKLPVAAAPVPASPEPTTPLPAKAEPHSGRESAPSPKPDPNPELPTPYFSSA